MKRDHLYAVVLAGGSSERLWPLSRQKKPKQFLSFDNQKTLLDSTIERLKPCFEKDHILISTTAQYEDMMSSSLADYKANIITEPTSRNTGPCILHACMKIAENDPEAVILFVPADSFIPDEDKDLFVVDVDMALDFASKFQFLVLLGIKPTYPASGYGYIEYIKPCPSSIVRKIYPIKRFHEKPSHEWAQKYVKQSNMLWNSGVVCAQAQVLIEEFKNKAPALYKGVTEYCAGSVSYDQIKSESIDYAVIEKSKCTYVLPVGFSWCDVGNVATFVSLKSRYAALSTDLVAIKAHNNVVETSDDSLVVLVGVNDLCIVKTADVLLIIKKDHAEQVRTIVEQLRKKGKKHYL